MEQIEYGTFKKEDIPKVKKTANWKEIFLEVTYKDLLIDLIGFMISRVVLFTNLLPLSIAFFTVGSYKKEIEFGCFYFLAPGL